MSKYLKSQPLLQNVAENEKGKKVYQTPILKEHGSAKDITLQTFFGTFSPPASD